MNYDPTRPIAVFLGPSLATATAREILDANYYAPVAMGHVYRLIASGVRDILIIDGVFHQNTPVWQREILAALDAGIRVHGAASMGALRAAELDAFGMRGAGRIYQWYRDGHLDGDDEVALLHTDAEHGFAPVSLPLVNVRHALAGAVASGALPEVRADALVAELKAEYFGARTLARLSGANAWEGVEPGVRDSVLASLKSGAADLKRDDALALIRSVAGAAPLPEPVPRPGDWQRHQGPSAFPAIAAVHRGWWRAAGDLLAGEAVLKTLAADAGRAAALRRTAARLWYADQRCEELAVEAPAAAVKAAEAAWLRRLAPLDRESALRCTGLTGDELSAGATRRVRARRLLDLPPERAGLDLQAHERVLAALAVLFSGQPGAPPMSRLREDIVEAAHFSDWARSLGIVCPAGIVEDFMLTWEARMGGASRARLAERLGVDVPTYERLWAEQATHEWLLASGPAALGFTTWHEPAALLEALQHDVPFDALKQLGDAAGSPP